MSSYIKRISDHYNLRLAACSALLTLSSTNYAFDNQGMAQTLAMNPFIQQFGDYNAKTKTYAIPAYFLSLMNSLVFIGFAIGVFIGSIVSDRYGRRMTVFTMSCWALVSATIVITSMTKEQMLVARILNYIYIGMELSVIPVFQTEIVPREVRGFAVSSYQMSFALGGLIVSGVCRGTSTINSNASWRIVFGIYYIVPTIMISLIWVVGVESPRWLMSKGRREDAEIALRKLRKHNDESAIQEELALIAAGLELEKVQGTYMELFKGHNKRRTLIVWGINFFLQATGQSFASTYGAVFVKSLGTINPFNVTIMNGFNTLWICWLVMYITDKVGRRPLFMTGMILQAIFLFGMGGVGTIKNQTKSTKTAIVAMQQLFNYSFTLWSPINYVVTGEIPQQKMRDKTQRTGSWVNILTNFVVAFTIPYLLNAPYANLGSKVGFIYGPICCVGVLFVYFCMPECRSRSLEEVDLLFEMGIGARESVSWQAPPINTEAYLPYSAEEKEKEEIPVDVQVTEVTKA